MRSAVCFFDNLSDGLSIEEIVESYRVLCLELVEKILAAPGQMKSARSMNSANTICNLAGPGLTAEEALVQIHLISGEIAARQATDGKIAEIRSEQPRQAMYDVRTRMTVTPEMIAAAEKMDPAMVNAIPSDAIRNMTVTPQMIKAAKKIDPTLARPAESEDFQSAIAEIKTQDR